MSIDRKSRRRSGLGHTGWLWVWVPACLIFSASALFALQSHSHQSNDTRIANFGKINDHYYRGSQPDQTQFGELKRMGIKTVIDLQADGIPEEPAWVRAAGLQYFRIPLSSHRRATDEQTAEFLKLVNDPQNWPVYVHCAGGRHRTGEMTAIYRLTHDGWKVDQAVAEMRHYGWFGSGGHTPTRDYVYDYYRRHQTAQPAGEVAAETPKKDETPKGGEALHIDSVQVHDRRKLYIVGFGFSADAKVKLNGEPIEGKITLAESRELLKVSPGTKRLDLQPKGKNDLELKVGSQSVTFKF